MTSFADSNPDAWERGRARAAAGDEPEVERGDAWDDLGGRPDNVRSIRPKPAPVEPSPRPGNVAEEGPRPALSDGSRRIIADIRKQLRDQADPPQENPTHAHH